jgi:hypothetical protein
MASYDSNFVLNIVPLFNTASPDGGVDTATNANLAIAALQTMVDTSNYSIKTNTIGSFTPETTLEILNNTNITGTLTINNQPIFELAGSNFTVSTANLTISTGAIGFFLLSTPILNKEVGGFQLYASTVFSIDTNNNFVFQPFNNSISSSIVRISTLALVVDRGDFSTLYLENLFVSQSSILTNLYTTGLSELPNLLSISTVINQLSVTGNANMFNASTVLGQFGHVTTSTFEVAQPIDSLRVNSLSSSTSTTSLLSFNDRITSSPQNLYTSSNILYYNGAPIGGTLSYAYELCSF